ncbi:MAG TPA: site-specific integrase, partial [Saprospiraceae bacterium]|nr:site-specific integrase [Saprospiraceae bacterium]
MDFTAFWEREIEAHSMKEVSKRAVRQTLNKIREMQKQVFFDDLTFAFIQEFDRRLRKQALSLNTINKHHKRLKTFISLAVKYGHLKPEQNPYGRFILKGEEPERPCLSEEELERLTFSADEKHLERHRDFLLLQCYTGLRFSDVAHLTPSKMSWSSEGITLHFKAGKTGKPLICPLYLFFPDAEGNSRPGAIVERYFRPLVALEEAGAQLMPLKIENQPLNRSL